MDADLRVDENGDTWVRVEVKDCGRYEYNKTKMDAYMDEATKKPIKIEMDMTPPTPIHWYGDITRPYRGRGVYV